MMRLLRFCEDCGSPYYFAGPSSLDTRKCVRCDNEVLDLEMLYHSSIQPAESVPSPLRSESFWEGFWPHKWLTET